MNLEKRKLRKHAKAMNLTQRNIAELTDLSYSCISQVFRGMSCSEATAVKIAQALSVPLYELAERGQNG